ncbi:hypothetical protein BDR26DRAFT_1004345 [Obelidium mucronatum]|nr:hypothetical protein BDR26DRAFT_1004345 [Obelidium mucronatum]
MKLTSFVILCTSVAASPLASNPTSNPSLKAYYPFDIDYRDYSLSKLPNAAPVLGAVPLGCENDGLASHRCSCFAKITAPSYLNLPAVQFQKSDFSWSWTAKIEKSPSRQILFSNFAPSQWQFLTYIDGSGCFGVGLRRNIPTNGADPLQDLISVRSKTCGLWNSWTDFDVSWSRSQLTLSVYINGNLDGTAIVPSSMAARYTSDLMIGNAAVHQFGAKLDTLKESNSMLTAWLRDFRIYNTSIPQFQDRCRNTFGYWKKF